MAAVTLTPNTTRFNVNGSYREQYYNITGISGDTLQVGLRAIQQVTIDPCSITSYSVAPTSGGPSSSPTPVGSIITFTASGPFTNINIAVTGQ